MVKKLSPQLEPNFKMQRFVLIDGNAILHRAYHALPPFTHNGEPVGAVFGFTSMLLKVISDLKPTFMAVTFDRPAPTFRQELFVGYQQGRPAMEEDLSSQVLGVHKIVEALDIPIFEVDGYEADDLIGTLATQAKKVEVTIVSGDRDLLQLVNNHVKVYMPIKGLSEAKMYGIEDVHEKYGLSSSQVIDMKALTGDASDNYPGVPGIGPKTASVLLRKYKTLENVYSNIGELPERQQKVLAENAEQAMLAKKLATIVCDAPVKLELKRCRFKVKDEQKAANIFKSFGFRTLTERLISLLSGKAPSQLQLV